jgi:Kef-type K+ transport system membrane component KefB/nucleotide-binding universal stress UspA family protein
MLNQLNLLPNLLPSLLLAAESAPPSNIIKPLGHHELLLFLLEISILLLVARALGELMRRFNLPPVVGELLAGVVLGPSLFGAIFPQVQGYIFPRLQEQANLLSVVSWLGVLMLLIVTGLETDLNLIIRKGKTALLISLGGIIVPFATGFGLGWLMPEVFLANPSQRLVFSLFIATAMSISAIPVIAKVLMDLKLIRRDIGQITLAAGMTDDTIGWILLSIVAGLAQSGKFDLKSVVVSLGSAILFLTLAFTVGRVVTDWILRWVDENIGGVTASLSAALILCFLAASLTHELGIEAALGAFVFGILIGQSRRFSREAGHTLEIITAGFLAPIFFASAGLKVDLLQLLDPQTLIFGGIVLAVACVGKFVGAYGGSRIAGLSHWEGLAMGSGMNARGAMEIIVATIGLSLGVLNQQMYSIIVMVAIVTSLMAPPLLRWTLSKVEIGEEEASRLEQEELKSSSFVKQIHRVLIPTRGGTNVQLATQLVGYLARQNPLEITALYVRDPQLSKTGGTALKVKDQASEFAFDMVTQELQLPPSSKLQTKIEEGRSKAELILNETKKNYDLVVLGATEESFSKMSLFNPLVDRVVQEASCSTMIVKSHLPQPQGDNCPITPAKLEHILVPTVGTEYSKNALEIASTIAAQTQGLVTVVNVLTSPQVEYIYYDRERMDLAEEMASSMVERQVAVGRSLGAKIEGHVLKGSRPEQEILDFANTHQVDLIVLGSNLRQITGRVFLGHNVDAILAQANCPVALITFN